MKAPQTYVKRRLQTFRFKGRPARGLYWKKDIYQEWFEWAKLSGVYPKDWGNLDEFADFEAWWKHPLYGFELFCEPPEEAPVCVLESNSVAPDNKLLVAIDKQGDPEKTLLMLRTLIRKHMRPPKDTPSRARYSPIKHGKYIKLNVLRRYRLVYTLAVIEGKTRRQLAPELMKLRKSKMLPDMRVVTRDLTAAKAILKNIAFGRFPDES